MRSRISRRTLLVLTAAIAFVLVVGYAATTLVAHRVIDDSFITGAPCSLPCWQGLVPGQSSETEAKERWSTVVAIDQATVHTEHPPYMRDGSYQTSWNWLDDKSRWGALHFDKSGNLSAITLQPDKSITVAELVATYGPPTYVTFTPVPEFSEFISRQPPGVLSSVLYVDRQFELMWFEETSEDNWQRYCPRLNLPVDHITIFAANDMEGVLGQWNRYVRFNGAAIFTVTENGVTASCHNVAP